MCAMGGISCLYNNKGASKIKIFLSDDKMTEPTLDTIPKNSRLKPSSRSRSESIQFTMSADA